MKRITHKLKRKSKTRVEIANCIRCGNSIPVICPECLEKPVKKKFKMSKKDEERIRAAAMEL
jgi:hypothetical protein